MSYTSKELKEGIKLHLIDTNKWGKTEYVMQHQLKEFSIAMQRLGLAWSERYNEYVIPDEICINPKKLSKYLKIIQGVLDQYNKGNRIVKEKEKTREKNQSYYTNLPSTTAMQSFINTHIKDNKEAIILDPAAGTGNLTDGLKIGKKQIWCIEPDKKCCRELKKKGYIHIINTDFETAIREGLFPKPTHVIMNPPFHHQKDIDFFNLVYSQLGSGGTIAAIISENSIYEELKQYKGVNLDENNPKEQAIRILANPEITNLSTRMTIFLENIVRSKSFCLDVITGPGTFQNTNARAYRLSIVTGEKDKKTDLKDFDEFER